MILFSKFNGKLHMKGGKLLNHGTGTYFFIFDDPASTGPDPQTMQ